MFVQLDNRFVFDIWSRLVNEVNALKAPLLGNDKVDAGASMSPESISAMHMFNSDHFSVGKFTTESDAQAWFSWIFSKLITFCPDRIELMPVDTHQANYPMHPEYKFDFSMCPKSCLSINSKRVNWYDICSFSELKVDLTDNDLRCNAIQQISSGSVELFYQQPQRKFVVTMVSDFATIQFHRFDKSGVVASQANLLFADLLAHVDNCNDNDNPLNVPSGFTLLLRFLCTPPSNLGFPAPPVLTIDSPCVPVGSSIVPIRLGHEYKPDVLAIFPSAELVLF